MADDAVRDEPNGRRSEEDDVRYADIGVNLTDPVFSGSYHGKQAHESDLPDVIQRARDVGCRALMITGSDLVESQKAVDLAREYPNICRATIGVHPCSSKIFEMHPKGSDGVLDTLASLIRSASLSAATANPNISTPSQPPPPYPPPLVAIGELGLDYDRLSLSPAETQVHAFRAQLTLLTSVLYPSPSPSPSPNTPSTTCPPLFLHSRAAHADFISILRSHAPRSKMPRRGVVHSFTGTVPEMQELLEEGWDIGVNGCSVRAEESLDVVRALPLGRMHLETDAPWCEIRPSSAGWRLLLAKLEAEDEAEREQERAEGPNRSGRRRERVKEAKEGGGWKSVKKEKWVGGSMVKGRNEPCRIVEVARVVAAVKEVEVEEVRRSAWENWMRVFGGDGGVQE